MVGIAREVASMNRSVVGKGPGVIGIDRMVIIRTDCRSIRGVIGLIMIKREGGEK